MKHRSLLAATIGCVVVSSSAFAGFTVTYAPSAQPATNPGHAAYDIFALNDADPADGVNLQGVAITITTFGTNNKIKLANYDDGTGILAEQWNFGSGAQQNTIVDLNASNFRIGSRNQGQHAVVDYTGDGTPYLTADEAVNGLSTFTAEYAVLSSSISVPASTAPGARFARVVVKTGTTTGPESPIVPFGLSGYFGGEVGSKSFATMGFPPQPFSPVVEPGATANVVFGQIVSNGAPFSVVVNVTDNNSGDLLSLTVGTVAGLSNVSVTPTQTTSPAAFTVTGIVDYSRVNQTLTIPVIASDGQLTGTGSFRLIVTPEPTSLGALALGGLLRRRRA